jgi:DnaJ-class molecular chaperone
LLMILFNVLTSPRSYKRLALKHSPQSLPNDPDAPARWEKITKAYEILVNPDKRMFYDAHGETPRELEGFDLAELGEGLERGRVAEY